MDERGGDPGRLAEFVDSANCRGLGPGLNERRFEETGGVVCFIIDMSAIVVACRGEGDREILMVESWRSLCKQWLGDHAHLISNSDTDSVTKITQKIWARFRSTYPQWRAHR